MSRCFYVIVLTIISMFTMSLHKSKSFSLLEHETKPMCWTNPIRYQIIQKYTKKYNLRATGAISSMPGGDVMAIGAMFRRYQLTSKAKARQIIVECVQDFLNEINSCEELQPYLHDHPFTVKNIDLTIFMFHSDGHKAFYPNLSLIFTRKDKIIFATIKQEAPNRYIEEEESFEEAVELVKTEIPPEDLS